MAGTGDLPNGAGGATPECAGAGQARTSRVPVSPAAGSRTDGDPRALIVGAGPAGLAVAACLRERGVPHLLLERELCVGASWRRHYDRLHLHTHKRNSGLPGRPWPAGAPDYPSRDDVVTYLEAYAAAFDLRPRFGESVRRATRAGDGWRVVTGSAVYGAPHLVIASGLNERPHLPSWPGLERFHGIVLHSSRYRNGAAFRERPVLVVGFGNSGGEIAVDLVEHGARVALSVRGAVNVVPRRMLGRPVEEVATRLERLPPRLADAVGRAVRGLRYGDLPRHGLRLAAYGPTRQVRQRARIPLIDVGTVDLIRQGRIRVRPGIERVEQDRVAFVDGSADRFDAIVLATGFRPGFPDFLQVEVGTGPAPGVPGGAGLPGAPGLHFCGFEVVAGGTLSRIASEAVAIAERIAAQTLGEASGPSPGAPPTGSADARKRV